ncbi:uncharacterized protein LOC142236774 [Haematobia irritans]|uniref:uncharacterized protein LOC142236774 n=1 Tax=Haematobia irritans TaxID=7368 RepID=UPI003F4F86D9
MLRLILIFCTISTNFAGLIVPPNTYETYDFTIEELNGKLFPESLLNLIPDNITSSLPMFTALPQTSASTIGIPNISDIIEVWIWPTESPTKVSELIKRAFEKLMEKEKPFALLYEKFFPGKPIFWQYFKPLGNLMFSFGINTNFQTSGQIGVARVIVYRIFL